MVLEVVRGHKSGALRSVRINIVGDCGVIVVGRGVRSY